ncbi:LPXTG cell wall anchor domain-containing protein [Kitasatospora sp. NPDC018058]|uniref:LPXTG cell wall anchor domain-containing protein n=1 Tax=Kitasatospora sp. NPDC018058 TaxID=3364025 RepID=UPI0037BEDEC9
MKLVDQDLGAKPAGHQGVATDLTGAGIDVQPHASHTFKLRFKLVQSTHEGPYQDVELQAFLAPAMGANGQAKDFTARAVGKNVKTTGLTTATTAAAAKPAAARSGAELAETGSNGVGLTAGIAGALLAAGGAAVVLTRRRTRGN